MTPEYVAWNSALAARFLQGAAGDPLYLYTDLAVLEEVSASVGVQPADAADEFVAAVRSTLGVKEPLRLWAIEAARKVPSGSVPPYLAVLCFLVFVAVEKETTRFQYYPELNAALGRTDAHGAPPGFDAHVAILFTRFNDWLEGDGAGHGSPTARTHEHFPNVGWPLSQAIVRPVDRALIVRLFGSEHLSPGEPRTGAWLRAKLVPRITTMAASSSRTRLLDLNEHHGQVLEDVLYQEYRAWNGEAVVAIGPRRALLRLCFDESRGDWWLLGPRVDGTERKRWEVGGANGRVPAFKGLEAFLPETDLWRCVGGGDIGQVEDGPILCSRRVRMRWLAVDSRAGAWAEIGRRDPALPHLLLTKPEDQQLVPALAPILPREDSPPGYVLLNVPAGVAITEDELPAAEAMPRLEGGLCLNRSTSTFLLCPSGLPVVRPAAIAQIDGDDVPVVEGELRLDGLDMREGDHRGVVDGTAIAFRLVAQLRQGWVDRGAPSWSDDLPVVSRFAVPWSTGSVWLVGEKGELEQRPGSAPGWVSALGLTTQELDVTTAIRGTWFESAYVITTFRGKPWVTRVPGGLARAQRDEAPRQLNRTAARELVSQLLVAYAPAARHDDGAWKRAFAGLLRTAHS